MENAYLVCLIVGGLYSLVSIILNGVLDSFDFDFEFDFEFGALMLPIKPFSIMVFVTVFGGAGLITLRYLPLWASIVVSAAIGIALALLLYYLVFVKLRRYETEAATEDDALMLKAEVVEAIPAGGYGKISYVVNGNTISGAAREKRPTGGIPKGHQVYITDMKDNVYLVSEDLQLYLQDG